MVDRRTVLAAAAGMIAQPGLAEATTRRNAAFPEGFFWGVATAAHQVEGNNTNSDCWLMEHVTSHSDVWVASLGEIARYVRGLGLTPRSISEPEL